MMFHKKILYPLTVVSMMLSHPAAAFAIEVNEDFKPQNEFKLDPWIPIHIGPLDLSINKAVFYLLLACFATILFFWWVTRNLKNRPDTKQTIVEILYDFCIETLGKANMPEKVFRIWFPYVATLFIFIWFSNMLGFIPLPIDTHNTISILGIQVPQLAIYAATANLSVPLALAFISVGAYHYEGIKAKGPIGYVKSWIPAGVPSAVRIPLFFIETISHFVRLISLSVQLFANMLAGHLLILMMLGLIILLQTLIIAPFGLAIGTGFYIFEVVLIASLQAFIFAILTAIYLGDSVAESH